MANIVVLGTNIFAKARESVYSASLTKASYRWTKKLCTLLDLCVSSLRRGHANLLCIVPILTDDPRRESENTEPKSRWTTGTQLRKTPSPPKLRRFPSCAWGAARRVCLRSPRRGGVERVWIPFGDHPLKLERYRED